MPTRVTVTCPDCEFEAAFSKLRDARECVDDHERDGHDPDWRIDRLTAGVERAGDDAGVCGGDDCNPDSPLLVDRE
ncbi:DUF7542 family protein [Halocalculus aciditolerans]|uniref:Uncharacterized protein n=1 Tax=Halocalculus aciditolerans TaxID=1383812 RepID=A0A830F7W9_9EURY|nr:hypothetical protein [Halocalculus aciditolerans]GGL71979.1 hypothetical protein GCM10009039_32590 [Halocalculus aciditolerans]